eukprot:gene17661-biopygen12386
MAWRRSRGTASLAEPDELAHEAQLRLELGAEGDLGAAQPRVPPRRHRSRVPPGGALERVGDHAVVRPREEAVLTTRHDTLRHVMTRPDTHSTFAFWIYISLPPPSVLRAEEGEGGEVGAQRVLRQAQGEHLAQPRLLERLAVAQHLEHAQVRGPGNHPASLASRRLRGDSPEDSPTVTHCFKDTPGSHNLHSQQPRLLPKASFRGSWAALEACLHPASF